MPAPGILAGELNIQVCLNNGYEGHRRRPEILAQDAWRTKGRSERPQVLAAVVLKTPTDELGLRTLVQLGKQVEVRKMRGKLAWEGDLDAMRNDK